MQPGKHKPLTQARLAVVLSKFEGFHEGKVSEEQYLTDSQVAAEVLWNAAMLGDLQGMRLVDLGAGTGILGIGAALLGTREAVLVEKDKTALETARHNLLLAQSECAVGKVSFVESDVKEFYTKADVVMENPPFGTKQEHADKAFLETAFKIAPVVYSFHKESTAKFVEAIAQDSKFRITHHWRFSMPLKASYKFHRRKIKRIDVGVWRLERMR